jgi:hypothetical protein
MYTESARLVLPYLRLFRSLSLNISSVLLSAVDWFSLFRVQAHCSHLSRIIRSLHSLYQI